MKKSQNVHKTFKQYLIRMAVVTNKNTYGMDARNILKFFKYRSIDKMRKEDVSADLTEVLEITYSAWQDSKSFRDVDPCLPSAGWEPLGFGGHVRKTHLCN